jgi:hypothetical protein
MGAVQAVFDMLPASVRKPNELVIPAGMGGVCGVPLRIWQCAHHDDARAIAIALRTHLAPPVDEMDGGGRGQKLQ